MSQTVHVVSIDAVTIMLGARLFHENDVKGAPDVGLDAFAYTCTTISVRP